ncbi:DUF11 domain-containing protein [Spirosoma rhododendri]|uniref:DUF11 domain-containing protein n=1 Tax=Spirosoma rhododendri TaxID=2728024 RepID=A0A7L5DPT6_9BACT|nr:DUF11 domain-containing protein [Spirosoma rhododendri]QJD80135.1 DUF11 domain-containing protein [Spirosoma rhododendri]
MPTPYTRDSLAVLLALDVTLLNRTPALNDQVVCQVMVRNTGVNAVRSVKLCHQLPTGLLFVDGAGWQSAGRSITTTVDNLPAGQQVSTTFKLKVTQAGHWVLPVNVCQYQVVSAASGSGPASDVSALADFRVR